MIEITGKYNTAKVLAQLDLNMNKDCQDWKREVIEYMRKYDA